MNDYERAQMRAINRWRRRSPPVCDTLLQWILAPATWATVQVMPAELFRDAVNGADAIARSLLDPSAVQRNAGVATLGELRHKDLALSDLLADRVHTRAVILAAAEGAAAGAGGIVTLPLDIAIVVTLALHSVHQLGLCYGYEPLDAGEREFALGIVAAAVANSSREKATALNAIRTIEQAIAHRAWSSITQAAVIKRLRQRDVLSAIQHLTRNLGINLMRRKALRQLAPAAGIALSSSANAALITNVGWAARRVFQERWLVDNRRVQRVRRPRAASKSVRN